MKNNEFNFEEAQEKLEDEMFYLEFDNEDEWNFTEEEYDDWMNSWN